jgi:GABA(A) receptor-associated protein
MSFKKEYDWEYRSNESKRVIRKYPDKVPIICEKFACTKNLPNIDKKKYLVPRDMTAGQFIGVIRKRIKQLLPTDAIFLFVDNNKTIVSGSTIIGGIYDETKDDDGFLYLCYSKENAFG